jgi:hypothetical protein
MNYNIQEIEQIEVILHDQVKNHAILPWIDHLLEELKERAKQQEDLEQWDMQEDMLRGATDWIHYLSGACGDIVSSYDLLKRHFQDEKTVDQFWNKICNDELDNDFATIVAAKDLKKAASLIRKALYLILMVKQANKEIK